MRRKYDFSDRPSKGVVWSDPSVYSVNFIQSVMFLTSVILNFGSHCTLSGLLFVFFLNEIKGTLVFTANMFTKVVLRFQDRVRFAYHRIVCCLKKPCKTRCYLDTYDISRLMSSCSNGLYTCLLMDILKTNTKGITTTFSHIYTESHIKQHSECTYIIYLIDFTYTVHARVS